MSDQKCKLCTEPYPAFALHFSNLAAMEEGYCSYFCMLSDLGKEEAMKVLQKYQERKLHDSGVSEEGQNGG